MRQLAALYKLIVKIRALGGCAPRKLESHTEHRLFPQRIQRQLSCRHHPRFQVKGFALPQIVFVPPSKHKAAVTGMHGRVLLGRQRGLIGQGHGFFFIACAVKPQLILPAVVVELKPIAAVFQPLFPAAHRRAFFGVQHKALQIIAVVPAQLPAGFVAAKAVGMMQLPAGALQILHIIAQLMHHAAAFGFPVKFVGVFAVTRGGHGGNAGLILAAVGGYAPSIRPFFVHPAGPFVSNICAVARRDGQLGDQAGGAHGPQAVKLHGVHLAVIIHRDHSAAAALHGFGRGRLAQRKMLVAVFFGLGLHLRACRGCVLAHLGQRVAIVIRILLPVGHAVYNALGFPARIQHKIAVYRLARRVALGTGRIREPARELIALPHGGGQLGRRRTRHHIHRGRGRAPRGLRGDPAHGFQHRVQPQRLQGERRCADSLAPGGGAPAGKRHACRGGKRHLLPFYDVIGILIGLGEQHRTACGLREVIHGVHPVPVRCVNENHILVQRRHRRGKIARFAVFVQPALKHRALLRRVGQRCGRFARIQHLLAHKGFARIKAQRSGVGLWLGGQYDIRRLHGRGFGGQRFRPGRRFRGRGGFAGCIIRLHGRR